METLYESAMSTVTTENNMLTCRKLGCNDIKTVENNLRDIIAFEPRSDTKMFIYDLPIKMTLQDNDYTLLSIIEFAPPPNTNSIGHCKSHCGRGTK